MAKKGDSLLSMLASEMIMLSMAQKLQRMPIVPNRERRSRPLIQSLRMENFSRVPARVTKAITAAIRLRKRDFCMVGTSPDSFTNTLIREKKKAARIIQTMPFMCPLCI